jgi:hypothetical protein
MKKPANSEIIDLYSYFFCYTEIHRGCTEGHREEL